MNCSCICSSFPSDLDQFGDTILFTTDDDILEAMSRYDETFQGEVEGSEGLDHEEELQRPRTADGEGEERPFTQAGFRGEDLTLSTTGMVGNVVPCSASRRIQL